MIAKKEIVQKVIYFEPNGKPVLEIVCKKYRRDFKGKYIDYIVTYTAYGAIAKRFKGKVSMDNEVKITYRIESRSHNGNYFTTLIVEKLEVLGVVTKDLFSSSNVRKEIEQEQEKELFSDAEKEFLKDDDVF